MNTVRTDVYAKLNLTLDVLGRTEGYHEIDSLVLSVNLSDRITARKRKDGLISVTMHGMGSESIPPEANAAQRAGEAFVNAFHTSGADIVVHKNIPIGGGMGGSSADAAGVLNSLAKLYGIDDFSAIKGLADSLGSDTGYLLTGGFARMRGRGEDVLFLGETPKMNFLLLVSRSGVSTAECYQRCDETPRERPHTERVLECLNAGNAEWAAKLFHNDLYSAAKELNPEVEEAYLALKEFSPWGVSMTGSGSAVFALFETEELCAWAKSRYRGKCRSYVLKSIDPKKKKFLRNPFALNDNELSGE